MLTIKYNLLLFKISYILYNAHYSLQYYNGSATIDWEKIDDTMPADEVNYILHTRDLAVGELYDRDNGFKSYKKEKRTKILIHGFGESPAK